MSEPEQGRFEPAGTAASEPEAASLVEPEGVNAGSADQLADDADGPDGDPVTTGAGSGRVRGRHLARNAPTPDELRDNGSQDPPAGAELLGASGAEPASGQDTGRID